MGEEKEIPSGLTFADVAKDYQDKFKYPIILAKAKINIVSFLII